MINNLSKRSNLILKNLNKRYRRKLKIIREVRLEGFRIIFSIFDINKYIIYQSTSRLKNGYKREMEKQSYCNQESD